METLFNLEDAESCAHFPTNKFLLSINSRYMCRINDHFELHILMQVWSANKK